jgi:hypothetical protein
MTRHLLKDRVILQSIHPLKEKSLNEITPNWNEDRIAGGLWGGGVEGFLKWDKAYKEMLSVFFNKNRFAGKDQIVMLSAYLKDPSIATIVKPNLDTDHWFYFQELLSNRDIPFTLDTSYIF